MGKRKADIHDYAPEVFWNYVVGRPAVKFFRTVFESMDEAIDTGEYILTPTEICWSQELSSYKHKYNIRITVDYLPFHKKVDDAND